MKKLIIFLFIILSVLSAQQIDTLTYKICINAGHGGHSSNDRPPATPAGYWESEGNLTRALALETILRDYGVVDVNDSTRAKFQTVMTRRNNRHSDSLPLSSICAVANNNLCDWMHSIHSNASGLSNSTRHRTLILYPGPTNDSRINGISGYPQCPAEMELAAIMGARISNALQTQSVSLAGDWTFYGTGRPYLGVFRSLVVPGTLSEGTFHDYYPETYRLQNLDFRINESWAIAVSLMEHFNLPVPNMANLAGIVRRMDEKVSYTSNSYDIYKPIDSLLVTIYPSGSPDSSRTYHGNTTMYTDKYTPQWSHISTGSPIDPNNWAAIDNSTDYDYYLNGYNNNHGYNKNNGFYMFDSLSYGTYDVVYDAPGFWPDTVEISISSSWYFWTNNVYLETSVPPFIKSYIPVQDETMHPAWEPVEITFSHSMDTAAVHRGFTLVPDHDLIFSWNDNLNKLTLLPVGDSLDVETAYVLTLEADSIKGNRGQYLDGNGDGIAGDDFILNFTTSPPDIYAPVVVDFYPPRSIRIDELQPIISFIFDELVDTTGGIEDKFELIRTSGEDITIPTVFDMYTVDEKTIVSLFPTEELVRGSRYARYAYSGLSDLFDNVTESYQVSSLLIDNDTPWYADTLVIDGFGSNVTSYWKQPGFSGTTVSLLNGSVSANDSIVNHGSASLNSMKLYYNLDPEDPNSFVREYLDVNTAPAQRKFDKTGILQVWVFGDGTGNLLRFAVDDPSGTGSHEVSPWFPLDFIGWQLMKWDLRDEECGVWETVSDGTLDGQLNFDSFQISYVDSLGNNEGILYFEDLWFLSPGGVAISDMEIPKEFSLKQNYPNPFNPVTLLTYQLPKHCNVNLSVYDINGREIANLINDFQSAGSYIVNFNAGPLPSGVYIARLKTDLGVLSRKMILVK